jgi:hypothetical protein
MLLCLLAGLLFVWLLAYVLDFATALKRFSPTRCIPDHADMCSVSIFENSLLLLYICSLNIRTPLTT